MNAQKIGLFLGPLLFAFVLLFVYPDNMSYEARAVLASLLWMATWWITEAVPIAVTGLLPLFVFPFAGIMDMEQAGKPYASSIIFLFLGGFILAAGIERWNLHRRIALSILGIMGSRPSFIILGFMLATGFLSMWLSNTATAIMMVPIAVTVIQQLCVELGGESPTTTNFARSLLLGIAYAASIGGIATLIGTPTNAILVENIETMFGTKLSFVQWMLFGTPVCLLFLLATWLMLTKFSFPIPRSANADFKSLHDKIAEHRAALGKMSWEEKWMLVVFGSVVFCWTFASLLIGYFPILEDKLEEGACSIAGAVLLFLIPARQRDKNGHRQKLMDWETAERIPWGILLLFGGGLSLADSFKISGFSNWIGLQVAGLGGLPLFVLLLIVITLVCFLTEVTSNMATAAMILPILASLSTAMNLHPYWLMVGATCASSCGFMMPAGTGPNAIVFASRYLRIKDMIKAGFFLDLISIVLFTLYIYFFLPLFLDF